MKNLKIKLEFLKLFLLEVEYNNNTDKGNENGKEVIHNDEPIVADQQQ